MKKIISCPYCSGYVYKKKINVLNRKVDLYICENSKWEQDEDSLTYTLTEDSSCFFRIFSNNLIRYNKKNISEKEIKELIRKKELVVRLYSKKLWNEKLNKYGSEYYRKIILDEEYGITVLFDEVIKKKEEKK